MVMGKRVGNAGSFRNFLADLQRDGLLKENHESLSPRLEVTDRAWGKAPFYLATSRATSVL